MRSLNHSWLGILVILCLYFSSWFHGEIKMDSRHPLHFKQSSFTLWGVDTVFRRCSFLRRNAHIIPVITTFNLVIALTKRNHLNQPWWGNIASSCCSRGFLHPPSPPPFPLRERPACLGTFSCHSSLTSFSVEVCLARWPPSMTDLPPLECLVCFPKLGTVFTCLLGSYFFRKS